MYVDRNRKLVRLVIERVLHRAEKHTNILSSNLNLMLMNRQNNLKEHQPYLDTSDEIQGFNSLDILPKSVLSDKIHCNVWDLVCVKLLAYRTVVPHLLATLNEGHPL